MVSMKLKADTMANCAPAIYELRIEGQPVPWAVYTRRGEPSRGFLAMKAWQQQIQAAVIEKYGAPRLTDPVRLDVSFFRELPGDTPKNFTTWERRCQKQCVKKPDRTNFFKALEDGLNGVLLSDDSIVVSGETTKWFAPIGTGPYTLVRVTLIPFKEA